MPIKERIDKMYKKKLEEQIEALEALQSRENAVEVSREILSLAKELDRLKEEENSPEPFEDYIKKFEKLFKSVV